MNPRRAILGGLLLLAACGSDRTTPRPAHGGDVDATAPETTLTEAPPEITNSTTAVLRFNGRDEFPVHFECSVDDAAWKPCTSPMRLTGLRDGARTFMVRAVDAAGKLDASPATAAWLIDTAAPETTLTGGPAALTSATSAAFTFAGADDRGEAELACDLDGAGWAPCESPATYAGFATGTHVFRVRARDDAGNDDSSPATATWRIYSPYPADPAACFQGGDTPQLDLFTGPLTYWTWNDPHVLRVGDAYWMYASATSFFTYPVRLYRLTATDGTAWSMPTTEPILSDAAPGAWDAGGLETPAVVFFGGKYHLFYTGYPYKVDDPLHSALDYRVGHAVSDDGLHFTRAATVPVVAPSGTSDAVAANDWYAYIVAEPAPVVVGGELRLYFTAVGVDAGLGTSLQVIGMIRTTDGVTWSAPEEVLAPDQTLYPRNQDWIGYSTPNAVVLDDRVHLFFDVAHQPAGGAWKQLRLHHASSADGVTGWTHDAAPIRSAGDFTWAVDEVRSPDVIREGSRLRLYFAGHELNGVDPEYFGIGMLTCDLAP